MRIVREVMPNGMPFLLQVEVDFMNGQHWAIDPKKIKVHPIMFTDESQKDGQILEALPFDNVKQRNKLAKRLVKLAQNK